MRRSFFLCIFGVLFAVAPAAAQFRYDEHRHHDYEAHWYARPQDPIRLIDAWHRQFFGGPAPPSWAATWLTSMQNGATPDDVLANMLATDEFYNLSGGTLAGLVKTAFTRLVGREPNPQEFNYWLNQAAYGSRADFAYALIARYPPAGIGAPGGPPGPVPYEYRPPIWRYKP
jgi:hypothetical protein